MYRGGGEGLGSELIPDHALVDIDGDLFGHSDLVDRLISVLADASTAHSSANIALYGSWGSGKSSIANLLDEKLTADRRECERIGQPVPYRFFCFDAFKYARKPFLRQFIRELADELPDPRRAEEYKERLYLERTRIGPRFRRNLWWVALTLFSLGLFVAGLASVLSDHPSQVLHAAAHLLVIVLFSSSLLVGAGTLLVPLLTVNSKTPAPDSEEQFEGIFTELLNKGLKIDGRSDAKLVVFVDELDRCSPTEVAATLETLRTFLGVEGCIFIVAADQQVLEQALTEHVRQATPPDPANPYYSAGSAYLDKIFQYQLALPPFRPRRLVDFALKLVEGRRGVWQQVDLFEVIPILLPTHVHSPRRVKVLLNAFALTYGIARSRAEREELGAVRDRAPEIAKLVCLRVEFPLFARDLNLDDRLTEAVVTAATAYEHERNPLDEPELIALPIEIRRRAIAFARGDLPAASLLAEGSSLAELDRTQLDFETRDAEKSMTESEDNELAPPAAAAPVRHSQALQLVRYLEKSIDVSGPYSDLIHLEAAGATFDLDPQVAQQLERDAIDHREREVFAAIAALDPDGRVNALRMLGQLAHESHGPDGRAVMEVLLRAVAATDVSLERVAPDLAPDLEIFDRRNSFDTADLPGAFSIAVVAKRSGLAGRLLKVKDAAENVEFRAKVLTLASHLETSSQPRLFEIASAALAADGAEAAQLLLGLSKKLRARILTAALKPIEAAIHSDIDAAEAPEADPAVAEGHRQSAVAAIDQLAAAAQRLASGDRRLAEEVLLPLLELPKSLTDRAIAESLAKMEPLRSNAAAEALLDYSREWALPRTAKLLGAVDPATVGAINAALDPLLQHIWAETSEGREDPPKQLWGALERLLSQSRKRPAGAATQAVAATLQVRVDSAAEAAELDQRLAFARRLASAGLIPTEVLGAAIAETLASTVSPPITPENQPGVMPHLGPWLTYGLENAPPTQLGHAHQALLAEDCWIASPTRETMALQIVATLPKGTVTPPSAKQIAELTTVYGHEAAPAVAIWVERFARTPESASRAVRRFASDPPPRILTALERYTRHRHGDMRARFALPLVRDAVTLHTRTQILRAARANAADEEPLVAAICELAAGASNPEERNLAFALATAIEPEEEDSWKALVDGVLIRFAKQGPTAFDLARVNLDLFGSAPPEIAQKVVSRMRRAVPKRNDGKKDKKRTKALERSLEDARLIEPTGRRIGPFTVRI